MLSKSLCLPWLLLAMLAVVSGGCAKKEDPATVTKRFFEQIAAGKVADAYNAASFAFRARQPERVFAQRTKEMGLDGSSAASWEPAEIEGKEAKLRGQVTARNGAKIPFRVTLIEESGAWRIYSLRLAEGSNGAVSGDVFSLVGKGASFSDPLNRPAPTAEEARSLARESLLRFHTAIQEGSFEEFYKYVALLWQKQLTVGQLQRAFQGFVDKKVNLSNAADAEIIFDLPPTVNTEGLLLLNGHFLQGQNTIYFALKYYHELPRWRLFGIDVAVKPSVAPPAP